MIDEKLLSLKLYVKPTVVQREWYKYIDSLVLESVRTVIEERVAVSDPKLNLRSSIHDAVRDYLTEERIREAIRNLEK